ncbi:MAG: hypothetical protein ACRCZF_05315, partial [Gemmataceae bacterium]
MRESLRFRPLDRRLGAIGQQYDDQILSRALTDRRLEQAADALLSYSREELPRAIAYILRQISTRANLPTREVSIGLFRSRKSTFEIESDAPTSDEALAGVIAELAAATPALRQLGEWLEPADLLALQQRTAIAEFREYIAHRQLVEWMSRFSAELPQMPVRPKPGRREVPARVLEEDAYPVGGYTSISNRGSIESLLHSQLAFMEPHDRPDLFDVKFVRDELFYYSRDENQFLRRRRKFIIRFDQSISQYRTKDPSLPVQRSVLMLAATAVLIDRLRMWLATDSLQVEYQFVGFSQELTGIEEARLLAILSQEAMARGETEIVAVADDLTAHS